MISFEKLRLPTKYETFMMIGCAATAVAMVVVLDSSEQAPSEIAEIHSTEETSGR